jgi:hypothetical protein
MHIIYCQNKGVGVAIMWKIDYLFMITRVRDSNAMAMWYTITNLTSTGVRSIPRSLAREPILNSVNKNQKLIKGTEQRVLYLVCASKIGILIDMYLLYLQVTHTVEYVELVSASILPLPLITCPPFNFPYLLGKKNRNINDLLIDVF